jgi:hypothetical protein
MRLKLKVGDKTIYLQLVIDVESRNAWEFISQRLLVG